MAKLDRRLISNRYLRTFGVKPMMDSQQYLGMQVIVQALSDIIMPLRNDRGGRRKRSEKPLNEEENVRIIYQRSQAINWFCLPNEDFVTVCDLAGIAPRAVRDFAVAIMEEARAN